MNTSFFDTAKIKSLRTGGTLLAAWAQLGSNLSAEILAEAGFDVLVIDMEHAPVTIPDTISMIQAIKGTGCIPFVRAAWNDMVLIKQILDTGAHGVHIPYVSTKEEAEHAVKCCKYAPAGIRGIDSSHRAANYSLNKNEYWRDANKDIVIIVAIETPEGVENIKEIASVEGVDGIFIGPADLSTSMGYLADPSARPVRDAILAIEKAVLNTDKFLATVAPNIQEAEKLYKKGYRLVYAMSDLLSLAQSAARAVAEYKAYSANEK
jgi:2-dehydro-3-deoxyglucarate aldolase/4-hydroxy-2-oxoheptanedioate aldolase